MAMVVEGINASDKFCVSCYIYCTSLKATLNFDDLPSKEELQILTDFCFD